ncbi:MAG: hypothetical protein ACLR6H_10935 [Roseburia sp.]
MKMKITILEDSVIESERLKNGIRKYGQQYDWDIEIDEYESGEEYFSKILKAQLYRLQHFSLTYKWGK